MLLSPLPQEVKQSLSGTGLQVISKEVESSEVHDLEK